MVLTRYVKLFYVARKKLLLHSCKYLPEVFLDICLPFVFVFFSLSQLKKSATTAPASSASYTSASATTASTLTSTASASSATATFCLHTFPQTSIQWTNLLSQDLWVNREFVATQNDNSAQISDRLEILDIHGGSDQ